MKMRVTRLPGCILVLIVCLIPLQAFSNEERPLSVTQATKMLDELRMVWATSSNLHQMAKSLDQTQHTVVSNVSFKAAAAGDVVKSFLITAIIYQRMTCTADRREAHRWLPEELDYSRTQLDIVLELLNELLPDLTNPAALADTRRLRDMLQSMRQELGLVEYHEHADARHTPHVYSRKSASLTSGVVPPANYPSVAGT